MRDEVRATTELPKTFTEDFDYSGFNSKFTENLFTSSVGICMVGISTACGTSSSQRFVMKILWVVVVY